MVMLKCCGEICETFELLQALVVEWWVLGVGWGGVGFVALDFVWFGRQKVGVAGKLRAENSEIAGGQGR